MNARCTCGMTRKRIGDLLVCANCDRVTTEELETGYRERTTRDIVFRSAWLNRELGYGDQYEYTPTNEDEWAELSAMLAGDRNR